MTDAPLIPASLYGLRTWRVAVDGHGEHLVAVCKGTRWPTRGTWLQAACAGPGGHPAPASHCACGIHAWHPRRSSARRVLAGRFEQPGIVEVAGQVELQHDGLRAERARPYAFVVTPGRNASLAERLARRYDARVVRVADAEALLEWCCERGLGLDERTVDDLLGPENASERLRSQRRRRRRDVLRIAAAMTLSGALLAAGLAFASGPPSGPVFGRTGWVTPPRCVKPGVPVVRDGRVAAQAPPARAGC
ncbi:MAG TPA: hypothetical protein VE570_14450 [Thermoleophilaceae bacterium]|nr:hypothetical protein [Thermoleophilaceae bacterium]